MSKGNTFENDLLKLIFNATAIANLADNAATSPFTNIHMALHTSDPGEAGTMDTNETTYTSYARVNVARTTGGWTAAAAGSTSPVANIDFPQCTGGTATITHAAAGATGGGAAKIFYSGTVTPNISVSSGVTPRLTTSSTITED
ncbi:MAG: phage tail fiber protein [Candidatus Binataceae bacterium]